MSESYETESEFELFMPFTVVQSAGGPYHDESFVVGYELGLLDHELQTLACAGFEKPTPAGRYVHTDGIPQVDLIAMRNGYTLSTIVRHNDAEEWTWVEFKPEAPDGG